MQNALAEAVAGALTDPKRRVYARAECVELTITADDKRHLDERDKPRKQEDLRTAVGGRKRLNKPGRRIGII